MAIKIDLLPKEAEEIKKINVTVNWLKLSSQGLLTVFVLATVFIFGWFFLTQSQINQVKQDVEQAKARIDQSSQEELKYRLYQEILSKADQVIKERRDFKGIFDDLYVLLPPFVTVKGFGFDKDLVIFEGDATGIQAFANVMNSFSKIGTGGPQRFKEVALTTVSRGGDGHYLFRMEISLNNQ